MCRRDVRAPIDPSFAIASSKLPAEEVAAIVDAAKCFARQTCAHASGADGIENPIEGGVDTVEHSFFVTREQIARMRVLRSATGTSSRRLNFAEAIGRIAPGCRSRMILTQHDALSTVKNLRREKVVLFDGRAIYCPEGLDSGGLWTVFV